MNKKDIRVKLKNELPFLSNKFNISRLGLFGSYVKGSQKKDSDIDILVEFSSPISMFTYLELEEYLEDLLDKDVDLVTKNALKPAIGKQILKEVRYIER